MTTNDEQVKYLGRKLVIENYRKHIKLLYYLNLYISFVISKSFGPKAPHIYHKSTPYTLHKPKQTERLNTFIYNPGWID